MTLPLYQEKSQSQTPVVAMHLAVMDWAMAKDSVWIQGQGDLREVEAWSSWCARSLCCNSGDGGQRVAPARQKVCIVNRIGSSDSSFLQNQQSHQIPRNALHFHASFHQHSVSPAPAPAIHHDLFSSASASAPQQCASFTAGSHAR